MKISKLGEVISSIAALAERKFGPKDSERFSSALVDSLDEAVILRHELSEQKRKADEYFKIIESIVEDRDRWKVMFFEQSSQHLNAQVLLENAIEKLHGVLGKLAAAVNHYRKEKGEEPLDVKKLDELLARTSDDYGKSMDALVKGAPASVDAVAMRDAVDPVCK